MNDRNDRLKNLNDGGYNNLLIVILSLVAVYVLVSGFTKSKQQAYLDNAGLDKNTQLAQALRDAMNRSGIALMMSVDGTDVALIMQTAQEISDYKAVSDAYRVLYNSELTNDLQQELSRTDLQAFWNIVYKTTPSTGGTTTGGNSSLVGKTVTCILTTNIRVDKAPYGVIKDFLGQNRQAKTGDILGKYVTERVLPDIPSLGNKNVFVKYEESVLGGLYTVPYWVLKSAVKIK